MRSERGYRVCPNLDSASIKITRGSSNQTVEMGHFTVAHRRGFSGITTTCGVRTTNVILCLAEFA
jgi:hypothetical protein